MRSPQTGDRFRKASGIAKGSAFSPGEGRSGYLIFLILDFDRAEAHVRYNSPEAPVRAKLPSAFQGMKRMPLATIPMLDAALL